MNTPKDVRRELAPGIIAYSGVLDRKTCDALIAKHEAEKTKLTEVPIYGEKKGYGYTRDCTTVFVNQISQWKHEKDLLIEAVRPYIVDYNARYSIAKGIYDTGFEFVKYDAGKICNLHVDINENRLSVFASMSLCLNDTDGGELVFPEHKLTIPMEAGAAFFFPASFAYPHYTNPAKGPRYVVITFFRYQKGRL